MRKRLLGQKSQVEEPTLVPLADMLSNTVGIMIFILIFTVLVCSGAVLEKHLPKEHETKSKSKFFFCWGNRVFPFQQELVQEFMKSFQSRSCSNIKELEALIEEFNRKEIHDEYVTIKGDAVIQNYWGNVEVDEALVCTPKKGVGENPEEMKWERSSYQKILSNINKQENYIAFIVREDSIECFVSAREIALKIGFEVGWTPFPIDKTGIYLSPGGRSVKPQ